MIIAGIASLLGAPIWIVLTLVALLFWRSRWVRRRPGSFKCAVRRASDGVTDVIVDVPSKFKLGYGLWVSNVFIWEKEGPRSETSFCQWTGSMREACAEQIPRR